MLIRFVLQGMGASITDLEAEKCPSPVLLQESSDMIATITCVACTTSIYIRIIEVLSNPPVLYQVRSDILVFLSLIRVNIKQLFPFLLLIYPFSCLFPLFFLTKVSLLTGHFSNRPLEDNRARRQGMLLLPLT